MHKFCTFRDFKTGIRNTVSEPDKWEFAKLPFPEKYFASYYPNGVGKVAFYDIVCDVERGDITMYGNNEALVPTVIHYDSFKKLLDALKGCV